MEGGGDVALVGLVGDEDEAGLVAESGVLYETTPTGRNKLASG